MEDQRAVAGALRMRLRGLGYAVADIAKDGEEAIEKAGALQPDLILMDIRLGDGIDGIEAARRIRSQYDIPVVYVTAYADHELLDRARATHPAGFINKPFTTKDLLTTINLALHRQSSGASAGGDSMLREAVLTTDGEGCISFLSSGAEQLTGWSRQTVIGQPLAAALTTLYPLDTAAAETLVADVIRTGADMILHRRGASDSEPGDILSALSDANGKRFGVALRFDGYTVESSLAVLQRLADASRFILDQVQTAAILLDPKLVVTHINALGRQFVADSRTLRLEHNRLHCTDEDQAETLRSTLRSMVDRSLETPRPGLLADDSPQEEMIYLEIEPDSGDPRIVGIARLVPDSNAITDTPLIALLLFDRRYRPQLSASVVRDMHSLTRSETRLVQQLTGGRSLEDGARELGISVNTARTHLKHIFHKTGARRQSELLHMMESGPASLGIEVRKNSPLPKKPGSD